MLEMRSFFEEEKVKKYINSLTLIHKKRLIDETKLAYEILINKDGIKKIVIQEKFSNIKRDLLDRDNWLAFLNNYQGKTLYFFDDNDLYDSLLYFAYLNGYLDGKLPSFDKKNELTIDAHWTKLS